MRARTNSAGQISSGQNVSQSGVSDAPSAADRASIGDTGAAVSAKQCLPLVKFFQCDDIVVEQLTPSIEEAVPGDLVCFHTGQHDPVAFCAEALARGASAILTEQLLPCPLPQAIVADAHDAACRISAALQDDPSSQMLTIGVVGEAGNTSTALLIAGVLKNLGIRTGYETDLGSSDGIVQTASKFAVPGGLELIARLGDARDAACSAMVIEYSGEQPGAAGGLKLDLLVVTGGQCEAGGRDERGHFGPDALSLALEQAKDDAVVIVPADHPQLVRRVADSGLRCLSYGLRRPADISAKVFDEQPGQTTLMVTCADETAVMETLHCGEAMAMNSLAAIAVGLLLETTLADTIAALCRLPMIPGRMQRVTGFDTAAVVIDSAQTPEQISGALRTLRRQRPSGGKIWCVFALSGPPSAAADHRHRDDRLSRCGHAVERFADRILLTSADASKASFLASSHAVLDGFKNVAMARLVADWRRAIQWAVQHAAPQDTILVLPGEAAGSALERRKALQQLETVIQAARRNAEARAADPQSETQAHCYDGPATIPMPSVAKAAPASRDTAS